ncbi:MULTISPECIES: LysR family transcriptional regulator [Vibrio]|uniref:LysR family transcriptional regulator n=2 Tax=Vibrio TaxID=662 RepID=A0A7X4RWQ8_9VIBR|nr:MULTISPECIES: LysR family transcriptional regulator [Vibrio]MBF8999017.1 LysR family transcriptional regulator [Vibrio nitrifigilis]MZI95620.1 LysR family transcriptional regulator [Vibrio eleionomae]
MTFEQLRTFARVVKLGGIRKAALEMNISQPAISARISALEEELGIPLLHRLTSGISPTKEGLRLLAHAQKIEADMANIKTEMTQNENIVGILRIGVAETIAHSWLSPFLKKLRQIYPKLVVELSVDVSNNLRDHLLNRQLDLAVLMGPLVEGNVENRLLPTFALDWYCSAAENITSLLDSPIISFARASRPYQELNAELLSRYGDSGQIFSSTSLSASLEMVANGIGVGTLPVCLATSLLQSGKIKTYDPGWTLTNLQFTASYLNDPRDDTVIKIADMMEATAQEYAENQ